MTNSASLSPKLEKLIFTEDYWKRPNPSPKGDDTRQPIYEAVGEALSCWEEGDQALADLFLTLTLGAGEQVTDEAVRNAVRRSYGSIISNAGRRLAVEAAAEVYFAPWQQFQKEIRKALNRILDAIQRASKLRDDIAHGIVSPYIQIRIEKHDELLETKEVGCFLLPPEYKTDRTHPFPKFDGHPTEVLAAEYCFTSKDIKEIVFKFTALRALLQRFQNQVAKNEYGEISLVNDLQRDTAEKGHTKGKTAPQLN